MLYLFTALHVVLCLVLMGVILLQPGKDAGMGAALGGGAATSAFGGRGAVTFLSRVTAVCAGLFFITSLALSFQGMKTSVAARALAKPPAPAAPAPAQPQAPSGVTPGSDVPPAAPAAK